MNDIEKRKQSVERLFSEPFKPQWMRPTKTELQQLDDDLNAIVEFNYRKNAEALTLALSKKYRKKTK